MRSTQSEKHLVEGSNGTKNLSQLLLTRSRGRVFHPDASCFIETGHLMPGLQGIGSRAISGKRNKVMSRELSLLSITELDRLAE